MRLIDADAVYKEIESYEMKFLHLDEWEDGYNYGLERAESEIECAPTVDAVPVIRCADCKHLNESIKVGEWDGSCKFWNTHSVLYSWFCSQAERKEKP